MKICPRCSRQYDDSKVFCPEHGTSLVRQDASSKGQQDTLNKTA